MHRNSKVNCPSFLHCFLAMACIGVFGCETPPPTNFPLAEGESSFVVQHPTRKSDWEFAESQFAVTPASPFQFVTKASRTKIEQSLKRIDEMPKYATEKPNGINDGDYAWLRRFTEPPPEAKWVTVRNEKQDSSKDAFCISRDGLQLVTAGSEVSIWDTSNGTKISSMPPAISNCKEVFFDKDRKSLYLVSDLQIARQSIADGQVMGKWTPANGPIVRAVKARDVDMLAAVTQNGDVVAFNEDLQANSKLHLESPFNRNLAIRANGRAILFTSSKGGLTWSMDAPSQAPEISRMIGKLVNSFEKTHTSSGLVNDHWIQGHCVHFLIDGKKAKERPSDANTYLLGFDVLFSHSATVDGSQDWLVTIGVRRNRGGKRVNQIQDVSMQRIECSSPLILDRESIFHASFDLTGERIAIRSEKGLEILSRNRWIETAGINTANRLSLLFLSGQFDRMEKCAAEIRKLGWRHFRWTGAEHWDNCAFRIANSWMETIAYSKDEELLEKMENWAAQKSDLALVVTLACSETIRSQLLSGKVNGQALERVQIKRLTNHLEKWNSRQSNVANLKTLFERGDPTPACFALSLYECSDDQLFTIGDRALQACVEKWPTCSLPHRVALNLLIKRSNSKSDECFAYVSALPRLLPPAHPLAKGMMACATCVSYEATSISGLPIFTLSQQNVVIKNIFSEVPLQVWSLESWMLGGSELYKLQRIENIRRMVEYHQQNYDMPTNRFYRPEYVMAYDEFMDQWMR